MEIKGNIVLITGASSGIGAATARAMAAQGGHVLLLARNETALKKVESEIAAQGGKAKTFPIDLSDLYAVDNVAKRIKEEIGIPDIIINNAGAGCWQYVEETTPSEAVEMMAVPYFAAFYITRAFISEMRNRNSGHILNITSVAAYFVWPGATAYTAARWAMRGFTKALQADLHGTGISVSLVAIGKVDSPYFDHNPDSEERIPKIGKIYPVLTTEQVATSILRAVRENKKEVIIPFLHRLTVFFHSFFPGLVEGLLISTGWKSPPRIMNK
jgi:short-subunit dehydrogenase